MTRLISLFPSTEQVAPQLSWSRHGLVPGHATGAHCSPLTPNTRHSWVWWGPCPDPCVPPHIALCTDPLEAGLEAGARDSTGGQQPHLWPGQAQAHSYDQSPLSTSSRPGPAPAPPLLTSDTGGQLGPARAPPAQPAEAGPDNAVAAPARHVSKSKF